MLPVVVLGAVGALGGAFRGVPTNTAGDAIDGTRLGLILAAAARDTVIPTLVGLVIPCVDVG